MKTFWEIFLGNKIGEILWVIKKIPIFAIKAIVVIVLVVLAFVALIMFIMYCGWAVHLTTGILLRVGGNTELDWYIATGVHYLFFALLIFLAFMVLVAWLHNNYERAELEYNNQKETL